MRSSRLGGGLLRYPPTRGFHCLSRDFQRRGCRRPCMTAITLMNSGRRGRSQGTEICAAAPSVRRDERPKRIRLLGDQVEARINCADKLSAQPSALPLIPECGLSNVRFCLVPRDNAQAHKLARMRSRAISQGVSLSGCASKASSRRSSFAICS